MFGPRSISSLRGELVPYLVRKQFTKDPQTDDKQTEENQKKKDASSSLGKLLSYTVDIKYIIKSLHTPVEIF